MCLSCKALWVSKSTLQVPYYYCKYSQIPKVCSQSSQCVIICNCAAMCKAGGVDVHGLIGDWIQSSHIWNVHIFIKSGRSDQYSLTGHPVHSCTTVREHSQVHHLTLGREWPKFPPLPVLRVAGEKAFHTMVSQMLVAMKREMPEPSP